MRYKRTPVETLWLIWEVIWKSIIVIVVVGSLLAMFLPEHLAPVGGGGVGGGGMRYQ